jgi:hypothetical protein
VYNASQTVATIAGDTYNLTAYAVEGQNGPNPPNCSITICFYSACSPATPLTSTYQQYFAAFLATTDDDSAPALFSIACIGNAYVGLDSIEIVDTPPPSTGSAATSSGSAQTGGSQTSMTTLPGGSVRTVTRTIVRTRTTSAIVSTAIYYTTTQYITSTSVSENAYTATQPTTIVSTAFETATSTQNFTVSAVVTSTSK